MRYPLAWAETAMQNSILKFCLLLSVVLTVAFAGVAAMLSLKAPIVVERACFSRVLASASQEHTHQEIESFLRIALEKRLSTDAKGSSTLWLSLAEEQARGSENKAYEQKNIQQRILVNSIQVQGRTATVEIDRILSVGKVKSVVPAIILVQMSSITRNEVNPYGLLIEKIELKKEGKSDARKN